jgi:hypothetical protein
MKKNGSKLAFVVMGILSFLGVQPASATPVPQGPPQIPEVKATSPLYLQLGADMLSQARKAGEIKMVQHWNHWSHRAHHSHWAHYAHRSHYAHYPRLCGRFARRSAKMVLGSQPTEFNLDKFPLL